MSHEHHHHSPSLTQVSKAFWIGIILNSVFVLIEFVAGFYFNSLALLSDAGHNLSDVASLGLSLLAFKMAESKSTSRFTYGYHKGTILASLANAVILLIAVGSIGWEAIQRFMHPVETQGGVIAIVAGIGIIVNSVSAFFFFRNKDKDLNIKGAYLHLATDALVSAGVVVAGTIISYTGLKWIDPLISLLIMAVVIYGTWSLLTESLRLSLDAVPEKIDLEKIKSEILKADGVKNIHHIHIWAMSTTKNAMTAHLILENDLSEKQIVQIKSNLKHQLEYLNIQHATFETESQSCHDEKC
ncbi:MAG: cation diffusion facilitator family transporter [Bacteroidota bacterium]